MQDKTETKERRFLLSKVIYTAVFVDSSNLPKPQLARRIEAPHVTLDFRPVDVPWDIFGEIVKIDVTGYANNGKNEGLKVKIHSENKRVMEEVSKILVPHITLSVAEGGSPRHTGGLNFIDVEPYSFYGKIGAFTNTGVVFEK